MRDPNVEFCDVCKKLFCCAACRDKHVVKQHGKFAKLKAISLDCPICQQKPLPLFPLPLKFPLEFLQHIENEHLPLHCQKCSKIYVSIAEINDFTSCMKSLNECNLTQEINNNQTNAQTMPASMLAATQNTIATQTSPLPGNENATINKTPLFLMQQSSKTKHKNDFISDSVSSIKNLSSLSSLSNISMRRSIDVITTTTTTRGQLVRTTSTPVQSDLLLPKPKEPTFNASSVQVSSIYNNESEHGQERTPALCNVNGSCSSPSRQKLDNLQKYRKISTRSKVAAVTPLRQVMSKSIQKAFAEHGALPSGTVATTRHKLMDSFECEIGHNSPLDLRVSPVVRRSRQLKTIEQRLEHKPLTKKLENITEMTTNIESPTSYKHQEIQMSSQKISTEAIVITRTQQTDYESLACTNSLGGCSSSSESVFRTCQSVEIITAEYSALKVHNECKIKKKENKKNNLQLTPISREPGTLIQKKIIHFETPSKESSCANEHDENKQNKTIDVNLNETRNFENSNAEAFFTPESTPLTKNFTPINTSTKTANNNTDKNTRKKIVVRRKLSGNFSPQRRPPIRVCSESDHFNRIAQVDGEDNDEVFAASSAPQAKAKQEVKALEGWSLGSLVSSVIALPTAIQSTVRQRFNTEGEMKTRTNSDSILKRCASIAGNLVRKNSLIGDLRSAKRKRIHTVDDSHSTFLINLNSSTLSSPEIVASLSKRFRIQPRRPLRYSPR